LQVQPVLLQVQPVLLPVLEQVSLVLSLDH